MPTRANNFFSPFVDVLKSCLTEVEELIWNPCIQESPTWLLWLLKPNCVTSAVFKDLLIKIQQASSLLKMNSKDDQNPWQNANHSEKMGESSKAAELTEEKAQVCKEIGKILSQVGDDFEQSFSTRHVAVTFSAVVVVSKKPS